MQTLSIWLYRLSSWPTIVLTVAAYGVFLSQVMGPHAAEMQAFAGDWGAPDGHFFYTPDELYAQLANWTAAGRQHYIDFRLGLDPVWALVYASFLITVTSVALRRAYPPGHRRRLLNLAALLPMSADILENFLGIGLVSAYPDRLNWLAWLAAVTSSFKWTTLGIAHLIMVFALGAAASAALRAQR